MVIRLIWLFDLVDDMISGGCKLVNKVVSVIRVGFESLGICGWIYVNFFFL